MSAYRKSSGYLEKASDILKENHRRFMESDGFQYFLFRQKWPSFAGELLVRESYIAGASIGEAFVFLRFSTFSSLARFPLLTHSGINYPPSASADGPPFLSRKELRFASFPLVIFSIFAFS